MRAMKSAPLKQPIYWSTAQFCAIIRQVPPRGIPDLIHPRKNIQTHSHIHSHTQTFRQRLTPTSFMKE